MQPAEVIARLCADPGRGACTDAERRAAVWMADELQARGHAAELETRWVRPQRATGIALAAFVAAAGSLLSVTAALPGLIAAAVAAVCLALDAAGMGNPLLLLTRRRATQHVVVEPPEGGSDPSLVVCARYDAPRRGLVLNDGWRQRLRGGATAWLAGCAALVAAAAAARWHGTDAAWLGAVQLVPTVLLIAAVAAALDVATSEFSPGADSASAAAVACTVYDELAADPPGALVPGLVLLGGDARRPLPAGAVVLEIGPCTNGPPGWRTRHPQLTRAVERAAATLRIPAPKRRPRAVRGAGRRPALRIACLDARGLVARSHQPDDTPDRADHTSADKAIDLALGTVDALDAELRRTVSVA
jgi:hypothetical protein